MLSVGVRSGRESVGPVVGDVRVLVETQGNNYLEK